VSRILAVSSSEWSGGARRPATLSTRELNVLSQVAIGFSNKQIAQQLGIRERTVCNHLSRVFSKLRAGNRTEAVMNAVRAGLLYHPTWSLGFKEPLAVSGTADRIDVVGTNALWCWVPETFNLRSR
jgi:DNA-binding CsgD family transcriptional regulator